MNAALDMEPRQEELADAAVPLRGQGLAAVIETHVDSPAIVDGRIELEGQLDLEDRFHGEVALGPAGVDGNVAPARHAAPETGALAKTASGALERQPYLRVKNLGDAIEELKAMGYICLGLAGEAEDEIDSIADQYRDRPLALVLGAEGPGLRERTRELCDHLVKIPFLGEFGSLNVSNAAAISLYAVRAKP